MRRKESQAIKKEQDIEEEEYMELEVDNLTNDQNDCEINQNINQDKYCDKECQVDTVLTTTEQEKTFLCTMYVTNNLYSDVQIQTVINQPNIIKIANTKLYKDKQCGTVQKTYVDRSVGPNIIINECNDRNTFNGITSVKGDEQLLDLAGVSFNNFQFLLRRLPKDSQENFKISQENRLFIFLIKMKTGLSFSAISVLFSIHRTTVSRIFHSTLEHLAGATKNLVFWPDKDIVQGTMPACFHPEYSSTRVIIDCTEFKIEVPASVDNRVFTYSHYKKTFTAKLLIGVTPGGFISFKSKVAGGRKSDSQMTIESGLVNLLEDGDVVLADKGFPEIRRTIDKAGKKVILVMPPFLERKAEFTKEETEDTYNIAKVRIHVERIMQRLRIYQILNKIPENLFNCVDDIVHMCCVFVNLQPPIISDKQ